LAAPGQLWRETHCVRLGIASQADLELRVQKVHKEVKVFWQTAAGREFDEEHLRPTARDPYLQEAIEQIVGRYLPKNKGGKQLLDIGSGDGKSTFRFSRSFERVVGVDYVEQFVARASAAAQKEELGHVAFQVCDATDLSSVRNQYGNFDVAVSIRCLINLATWENQKKGIREAALSIKPGGLYILSEGWKEGMDGLNKARTVAGLQPINVVPYNLLIDRAAFEYEILRDFTIEAYESLGLYIYFSRVVQPLLVAPDNPRHDHRLNWVAMQLAIQANRSCFDDCDYAGVLVLRRR
jgi:ubiquinone/menaquinone biosynthesis C-methylase UbiE